MASTESPREYEVFLSFRGEDTRYCFTDHLYGALVRQGIVTFRDDEQLEIGQPISPELLSAIEKSRMAVVVLSENYASSSWCLQELAKIVECRREREMRVFPIFYHVNPSDVRRQKGTFAGAFAEHENRFKENLEMVQAWRDALKDVADLKGLHLEGFR